MHLPCAILKMEIEDRADMLSQIEPEATMRLNFSSASAVDAQEQHSFLSKISTQEETRIL
jgi:hypothetical protein